MGWGSASAATRTSNSGPSADHTTGSGFYALIDGRQQRTGDESYMQSVPVDILPGTTLSFWLHYYGRNLGTLLVSIAPCSGETQVVGIVNSTNNYTSLNEWRQVNVSLPTATNARIRFTNIRGNGMRSNVAIDDVIVKFAQERPSPVPTPAPTADVCAEANCGAFGECKTVSSTTFECACFPGYAGTNCSVAPFLNLIGGPPSGRILSSG